ncbi:flagellar assembly protein FliH [Shewanella sp. UCD-KL12]|uniref:flagellar assembly protein FliH n=1 Tax=Shewanella sp. UCD-KL12 TaxID=1917163 RepID=UPI000970ADBA|nr:flagellar assembly protein FliH [Shewanella sp. UCD-KL12]
MKPDNNEQDSADVNVEVSDYSHWQIPDITEPVADDTSNLFGRKTLQKTIEDEAPSFLPPTLVEIEAIRDEAIQDGFSQGKEEGIKSGIESGRLEGLKQGHEEGLKQGIEQGHAEGLEQAAQMISRFESLIAQFEKPLELLDTEIEKELVALTMMLARTVIGHEIKTHPEHILSALRQGVDSLPIKEQGITIRLHPDDHQLVQQLYTAEQLEKSRWLLEADPSLTAGDCVIHSQRSSVDMRLEQRINSVFDEMNHHHQHLAHTQLQQEESLSDVYTKSTADESSSSEAPQSDTAQPEPEQTSSEVTETPPISSDDYHNDQLKDAELNDTQVNDSQVNDAEGVDENEQSAKPTTE